MNSLNKGQVILLSCELIEIDVVLFIKHINRCMKLYWYMLIYTSGQNRWSEIHICRNGYESDSVNDQLGQWLLESVFYKYSIYKVL